MNVLRWLAPALIVICPACVCAVERDCSARDTRPLVPGVLVSLTLKSDEGDCSIQAESQKFLRGIESLAASSWRVPIGWFPFPSTVLEWEFSKSGSIRHFVVVEGTSEELPVCGRHVLYSAVEALKAEFPRCLTGAKLRADFKIPWNFIGPLEFPEGEASRKSTIIFESQDLKNVRIEDIQDLPNDDPEEDIEQPSE